MTRRNIGNYISSFFAFEFKNSFFAVKYLEKKIKL